MLILFLYHWMNLVPVPEILEIPHFHHQYSPNVVEYELGGFSKALKRELNKKGHRLKEVSRKYGNLQVVEKICSQQRCQAQAYHDPRMKGAFEVY